MIWNNIIICFSLTLAIIAIGLLIYWGANVIFVLLLFSPALLLFILEGCWCLERRYLEMKERKCLKVVK